MSKPGGSLQENPRTVTVVSEIQNNQELSKKTEKTGDTPKGPDTRSKQREIAQNVSKSKTETGSNSKNIKETPKADDKILHKRTYKRRNPDLMSKYDKVKYQKQGKVS